MGTFRTLVVAVMLAGLVAPVTSGAAQRPARSHRSTAHTVVSPRSPNPLTAAQNVGRRYWGALPCNGRVSVVARTPLSAGVDPTTDAWVTFDSSLGTNDLSAPAASYRNCKVFLARWRWPTSTSMSQDWDMLCTTMVHEMGHLLGRPHDLRHGSVMAPVFTDSSSEPPLCRATRPRAAR